MKISKITMDRLYNLGSYEHVKYSLTVEVGPDESAATAITGMEKILAGLAPLSKSGVKSEHEIAHEQRALESMKTATAIQFQERYGHWTGTPAEIIARCENDLKGSIDRRNAAIARAKAARQLFDDLGGAAQWKDAKLDWEDYQDSDGEF